jgi:hypothetical protein
MSDIEKPVLADPVAQEAKLVGDDALEVREVPVDVHTDEVAAQVAQPREADSAVVHVHETSVTLDEVITDPSDPRAVQIPDAGRGSLDLPIHGLSGKTPEQVFADSASDSVEVSDEDRAKASSDGKSVGTE